MKADYFLLLLFCSASFVLNAQSVEMNKYVLEPFGLPASEVDWVGTTKDAAGNLVTVGNTFVSADITAVFVTKHNSSAEQVWQVSYYPNLSAVSKNYGIAVTTDVSGNIYVAAATRNGANGKYDYLVLKYSPSGNLTWSRIINGASDLDDLPAVIALNNSGELFVAGTSMGSSTLTDYLTLHLDPANGNTIWSQVYDNDGNYEAAVDISFDLQGNPVITGLSGTSFSNNEIATVKYGQATGSLDAENHFGGGTLNFTNPKALTRDQWGNFYIAGEIISAGTQDISLIKLDTALNLKWTAIYDYNNEKESVNALTTDSEGNVLFVGNSVVNTSFTDLLVVKYDSSGTLKWAQRRTADKQHVKVTGKQIKTLPDNSMYVLGERLFENRRSVLLVKLGPDGTFRREDRHPSDCFESDDVPVRLETYPSDKRVVVLAKSVQPNETKYYHLRFDEFDRNPAAHLDTSEVPICKKAEIIVKFNRTYVLPEKVNDLDITFGDFTDFLTADAAEQLERTLPGDRHKLIRIFTRLRTTDTLSISRLGEPVRIPDFWTAFVLTIPESSLSAIADICQDLEALKPYVLYAHPNYIATDANNCPDDPPNEKDDGIYIDQISLHPDPLYPDGHINVEPAWGCTVGKPTINVGVYDDLLGYRHEDFEYDIITGFSAVKGGWDFKNNTCITCTNPPPDPAGTVHGTQVAGILGAVRDNHLGVAGVAGGSWSGNQGTEGVSIYSMRVLDLGSSLGWFDSDLKYFADAIIRGASKIDDPCCDEFPETCFQLDIMNFSLQYYPDETVYTNTELVEDAIHFAYGNQVIICAARGNEHGESIACPACYEDDWTINVSATNAAGSGRLITSNFGEGIDIAAPGSTVTIWTTTTVPNGYGTFGKTSAATPHVSGVAGLLLSIDNIPGNLGDGTALGPEDVENIVFATARDIEQTGIGPDIETGPGMLDAGNAVDFLLDCNFYHFGTSNLTPQWQTNLVEQDVQVQFTRNYTNPAGNTFLKNTPYKADVYKITANFQHNLGQPVTEAWPRPSSSNTFALYSANAGINQIEPKEKCSIDNITSSEAILSGYAYAIKNMGGSFLGYAPFDPNNTNAIKLAYSVRACEEVATNNPIDENVVFYIQPNPAVNVQTLVASNLPSGEMLQISLYDAAGRFLKTIAEEINHTAESNWQVNLAGLPVGCYFYKITIGSKTYVKSFVKSN